MSQPIDPAHCRSLSPSSPPDLLAPPCHASPLHHSSPMSTLTRIAPLSIQEALRPQRACPTRLHVPPLPTRRACAGGTACRPQSCRPLIDAAPPRLPSPPPRVGPLFWYDSHWYDRRWYDRPLFARCCECFASATDERGQAAAGEGHRRGAWEAQAGDWWCGSASQRSAPSSQVDAQMKHAQLVETHRRSARGEASRRMPLRHRRLAALAATCLRACGPLRRAQPRHPNPTSELRRWRGGEGLQGSRQGGGGGVQYTTAACGGCRAFGAPECLRNSAQKYHQLATRSTGLFVRAAPSSQVGRRPLGSAAHQCARTGALNLLQRSDGRWSTRREARTGRLHHRATRRPAGLLPAPGHA